MYSRVVFVPDEPPTGGGNPPAGPPADPPADKTFSQADLDRIVQDRIARERQKFGDYDDLKAKATKLDEIEQANASDLDKEKRRADEAEQKVSAATERLRHANLLAALAANDSVGPKRARAAVKLIDGVEFDDDGEPQNLDARVTALLAEHDFLKATPGRPAGTADGGKGQPGGGDVAPGLERLRRAFASNT